MSNRKNIFTLTPEYSSYSTHKRGDEWRKMQSASVKCSGRKLMARGFTFIFFALFFLFSSGNNCSAEFINPPVIGGIEAGSIITKPIIRGTTQSGTYVNIYIDGVYNGKTVVLFAPGGVDSVDFSYEPYLELKMGQHSVWTVARDENKNESYPSNVFNFNIEAGVPAPVIFSPIVNKNTTYDQPFIRGLSKNNLTVKIFIDNKLDGEFKVENNESGTANFSYKPASQLSRGQHTVFATAEGLGGEQSNRSNIINFKISSPDISNSIEEEVAPENQEEKGLEELLNQGAPTSGLNENGEGAEKNGGANRQSKKLIIFIIFIIVVIAWIIWQNRELIKEKGKQIRNKISKK